MKYLTSVAVVTAILIIGTFSQSTIDPTDKRWGWTDYKQLACDNGYNKVGSYCVKCDADAGKFFNPVSKKCDSCPAASKFNTTTQSCGCGGCALPQKVNSKTGVCECQGFRVLLDNKCQCPSEKPLWNNKYCVKCPQKSAFDPKQNQCYYCPQGFAAAPGTHNCLPALGH